MKRSIPIVCGTCGASCPGDSNPHRCPECGGLYEIDDEFVLAAGKRMMDAGQSAGSGDANSEVGWITLGEGSTPLIPLKAFGRTIYCKCEHLNPTGSFKDRGTAELVNALLQRGVKDAVEDSSGNAGASFAAYAAAAGMKARVFMPAYASGPKKLQIEAYGAEMVLVEGPRSKAAEAVLEEAASGVVYASHAWLPYGQLGIARAAFELVSELGQAPGAVITPAGHGSMLLGLGKGFTAAERNGAVAKLPPLVGVQARACAPLYERFHLGKEAADKVSEGETAAEGIRILHPYRAEAILEYVKCSGGTFLAVEEKDILAGHRELRTRGLHVEKTSAVVWPALEQVIDELRDPVVVILTGNGLKEEGL